ncbi:hypothetical protein ACIP98_39775 [Streptomyces sp. NPDC088354]|uniref:hypothetical protein n=1 Tax=Streptomyces sp. NPDC088354 TaxID=3365856 RepID=UPI0037F333FA
MVTVAGPAEVKDPRVNDCRVDDEIGERERFSSKILPPWCCKSPRVSEVPPQLYLHGLSSGEWAQAVTQTTIDPPQPGSAPAGVVTLPRHHAQAALEAGEPARVIQLAPTQDRRRNEHRGQRDPHRSRPHHLDPYHCRDSFNHSSDS